MQQAAQQEAERACHLAVVHGTSGTDGGIGRWQHAGASSGWERPGRRGVHINPLIILHTAECDDRGLERRLCGGSWHPSRAWQAGAAEGKLPSSAECGKGMGATSGDCEACA